MPQDNFLNFLMIFHQIANIIIIALLIMIFVYLVKHLKK